MRSVNNSYSRVSKLESFFHQRLLATGCFIEPIHGIIMIQSDIYGIIMILSDIYGIIMIQYKIYGFITIQSYIDAISRIVWYYYDIVSDVYGIITIQSYIYGTI